MNLGKIRAYGKSRTRKSWVTNPVRAILWQLVTPYFEGIVQEVDQRQRADLQEIDRRQQRQRADLQEVMAEIDQRQLTDLQRMAAEIDQRQNDSLQLLAVEVDQRQRAELGPLRKEISSAVASHLAGTRKDAMAMAHRLAGLEAAAAVDEQARIILGEATGASTAKSGEAIAYTASLHQEIGFSTKALEGRIDTLDLQAREAAAYISAIHQEVRLSIKLLSDQANNLNKSPDSSFGDAVNAASAQAGEAASYVAALHQEVRVSIKSLSDRIDFLMRGAPLRAGDRISVGRNNLILAATANNSQFLIHQHDLIGHLVADGHEWEPHVRIAIERAARPDGVAVDAGAYIGLHTVTMARCFGTVHAFEPQHGIYQTLCGNLALNDCVNVIAHNLALYDRAKTMRLAPAERQEIDTPLLEGRPDYTRIMNAAALTFETVDDGSGSVRAVALDDLCLEAVALIKIDTQGADLKVLQGAESTIRRFRPFILFEWERDLSAQHGSSFEDYHVFFDNLDYDVTVLQETSPGRQVDYLATPR